MSKYIKLEDAIEAYNQAVTNLVESEMEEFDLGDFTECSFNTTQIKLIARMIENLPTIEVMEYPQVEGITPTLVTPKVSEDCISRADLIKQMIDFQNWDTTNTYKAIGAAYCVEFAENAPSVVPSRAEGEWLLDGRCSECLASPLTTHKNYCPNCGVKMKGVDDES